MLKRCVVDSIAILLCMCFIAGCGGGNKVVDNVKDVANSKMETAANALGQATSHPKYAQFRALKLNCSYDTACKIMLGKPTFQIGGTCTWASNGDTILCSFENDKLYLKSFDTKKIILKDAFSIDQFNKIQKGDSYDTVKGKLNKQDGYLSAHYITPIGEYEQYSWRNSDETIAEILFVKGNVCDKKIKGLNNGKPPVVNTPEEKAKVTSSNSAGSDVRDPVRFGKIDEMFLGKWKRTGESASTLTIEEADPQKGGYYVKVFFYRLADLEGYAHIEGNNLSISQGTLNRDHKFSGTIEKVNGVIRFTVTESSFSLLKSGHVCEFR